MSNKINDIVLENLKEQLDEIGGIKFEGETLEEALMRERTAMKLHGFNRNKLVKLLNVQDK